MARLPRSRSQPAPRVPPPAASFPAQTPGHAPQRSDLDPGRDPYQALRDYPQGTVCRSCGAVYDDGRWVLKPERREEILAGAAEARVTCAGCQKRAGRDPGGVVTLEGPFWRQHWQEIRGLLRNEEERVREENPTSFLIDLREREGVLEVTTTNPFLARRLGQALHAAYRGEVDYVWSGGNHLVRVRWRR